MSVQRDLTIEICETSQDAPNWSRDHGDVRSCRIENAYIVKKGMQSGKATVDLLFTNKDGEKYVVLMTGRLIKGLAVAIERAENT